MHWTDLQYHKGVASFHWQDTQELLTGILTEQALAVDDKHGSFLAVGDGTLQGLRFTPPLLQPIEIINPHAYALSLASPPGMYLVILMQAGATALGTFENGELLRHKCNKRYVVRGSGKAQPTHLQSKGKSRFGSRLRLQNHKRLQLEAHEKLRQWRQELGEPALKYYACPVRTWSEFFLNGLQPAYPSAKGFRKIPSDFPVPSLQTLTKANGFISHGRVQVTHT